MTYVAASLYRSLFSYDPEIGSLRWRERERSWFRSDAACKRWNTMFAGKPAGYVNPQGYLAVMFNGVGYQGHRIIWAIVYGEEANQVDHINGVRSDNRICNFRSTSVAGNAQNRCRRLDNASGVMGVCWHRGTRKWVARIGGGPSVIHLGSFVDLADAIAARRAAEVEHGYHPNHGRAA